MNRVYRTGVAMCRTVATHTATLPGLDLPLERFRTSISQTRGRGRLVSVYIPMGSQA